MKITEEMIARVLEASNRDQKEVLDRYDKMMRYKENESKRFRRKVLEICIAGILLLLIII